MAMDINLNGNIPQMPLQPDADDITAKAEQAVEHITTLLNANGNVQVSRTRGVDGSQSGAGATTVPVLDDPDVAKALKADLEALLAYLQMQMDEKQAEVQTKRINSLKGELKSAHDSHMSKIDETIKKAKEQEKAAKAQRALNWLGAIFACVVAAVVTVCTGGLAAGFAIAGAALAVASLIMSETGADRKIMKAMSKSLQENFGMSKQKADAWAQGIYGAVELVLGLTCAIGGGVSAARAAAKGVHGLVKLGVTAARVVSLTQSIGGSVLNVASMSATAASTALGYQAGMKQADATEAQAILNKLQKFLEESEEDLQNLLQQITNTGAALMELLESKTDTLNKITQEIGLQNA